MSFKAIDLQFAVHKNDEAGIKQNQLMQKPRQDGTILENQATQTTESDRHGPASLKRVVVQISWIIVSRRNRNIGKSKTRGPVESRFIGTLNINQIIPIKVIILTLSSTNLL